MLALLDWVYGPGGVSDPYYQLMRDILLVMPWWYPYFWLGIGMAFFGLRYAMAWRRRRAGARGARRVKARTHGILTRQAGEVAARRLLRQPANDFADSDRPSVA